MRIAYVLDRFPSPHQTFVRAEIEALERRGHEIRVFSLQAPPAGQDHGAADLRQVVYAAPRSALARYARVALASIARSPARGSSLLPEVLRSRNRVALTAWLRGLDLADRPESQGIDHLHAHFATGANVSAMTMAMALRRPFSFTTHAVDLYARPCMLEESLRRACRHVTISEHNREHLRERYGDWSAEKSSIVRASIDMRRIGSRAARPVSPPRIVSVGRLVPKKGHDLLIAALAELRDQGQAFSAEIIGDGPLHAKLQAKIDELGLGDRLCLSGTLSQEAVIDRLSGASVFVLACRVAADGDRDGVPVSIMEAMALGLPVISTRLSGIPELVDERSGILLDQGDPAGLANAIAGLLETPERGRDLGLRAAAVARERCDVDRSAADMETIFEACQDAAL